MKKNMFELFMEGTHPRQKEIENFAGIAKTRDEYLFRAGFKAHILVVEDKEKENDGNDSSL